jgi:hypothetical protein
MPRMETVRKERGLAPPSPPDTSPPSPPVTEEPETISDGPIDHHLIRLRYTYQHLERRLRRNTTGRGGGPWLARLIKDEMTKQKAAIAMYLDGAIGDAYNVISDKRSMYTDTCIWSVLAAHRRWKGVRATIIESTMEPDNTLREALSPLVIAPTHRPGVPGHWVMYVLVADAENGGAAPTRYTWYFGDSMDGTHRPSEVDRIVSIINNSSSMCHSRPAVVHAVPVPLQRDTRSCGVYAAEVGVRAMDGKLGSKSWDPVPAIRERQRLLVRGYSEDKHI